MKTGEGKYQKEVANLPLILRSNDPTPISAAAKEGRGQRETTKMALQQGFAPPSERNSPSIRVGQFDYGVTVKAVSDSKSKRHVKRQRRSLLAYQQTKQASEDKAHLKRRGNLPSEKNEKDNHVYLCHRNLCTHNRKRDHVSQR